jgi:hypothetical protein
MVRELPIPNPFPSGKGLLLYDELACLREGLIDGELGNLLAPVYTCAYNWF